MTTETKQRIEAYKRALPEMRERVMAVAILLVMSISMMASASFAWLTLSRHPEVSGVNTSVAANGNLEIALATGEVNTSKAPDESKVGDSSAAKGQSVASANITWGNLVNLSDSSYGLENLTLRPAQLNQSSLLVSPLYGAVYKEDGRVEKLNSSFAYSTWDIENEMFMVSDKIGVRAISSTKLEAVGFAQQVYEKRSDANTANLLAGSSYLNITTNKAWMDSLAVIMGTFMTAKMNAGQGDESLTNPNIANEDVQNLTSIFGAFVEVYELQFKAMANLVNYQLFLKNNSETGSTPYTPKTAEDMKKATTTEKTLKDEGLQVSGLDQAKKDYDNLMDGYAKLKTLSEQGSVKWEDSKLNVIVNSLMDVGTCTLDGTKINNIGASNASGYLDGKTHKAEITNGVLYNFEKMNGTTCKVEDLSVSAKVKRMGMTIPASIKVNITTTAPTPSQFYTDLLYGDSLNQGAKGVEVAQDTYGLAVDLWVRTNATDSYLTLEGNVLTKTDIVRDIGTDVNGNEVELFTLTRTVEETADDGTTQEVSYDLSLYKLVSKDESGNEVTTWYNAETHSPLTVEEDETPIAKMKEVVTVIGFEGENRIWEDANAWEEQSQLSLDATTQGSGSCYVYYADTPEDQARSLKLLEAMNVAFVDDNGDLMATASMDTEMFYAENGRVTVPLVLQSDSLNIGTDNNGNDIYAITPLVQNEPKRITAIVYLDGTKLSNQDVLAASDIQGKMNIQFGSSVTLSHAKDETLLNATRTVSASVSNSSFKYDESKATNTPMTTTVTVNVDGDEPNLVTAFFIRAISSTQGSREDKMTFTKQSDGSWKADYTFKAPGNYILRSVELDGQTYDLKQSPTVIVEGFTVKSLEYTQESTGRHVSIMTAASSSTVDLRLQFASDKEEAMPTTVQGRFLRNSDGTAVNINFTYNPGGSNKGYWTGQATFISSGEYTLEYLVLDGEYAQLDSALIQTATIYLGMKTAIYTDSPTSFLYVPSELDDNQLNLYMKVKIMDNTGKEMEGLQNVFLYYQMQGSSLAENGYDAPLTWNGTTGYYECEFLTKVGVFKFSQVMVGSNTITYAETSPVFKIISPNPPEFVSIGSDAGQTRYYPNGDGTMEATFDYSATATVMARIRKDLKDGTGKVTGSTTYYVMADNPTTDTTNSNRTTWKFALPSTEPQDGYWTMEELYVWDYYTVDGKLITTTLKKQDGTEWDYSTQGSQKWINAKDLDFIEENSCMRVDIKDKNYWKKIIEKINIKFTEDKSQNFTGNNFMTPYTVSGLSVDFEDFQGMAVVDQNGNALISDVRLVLEYVNKSSSEYGGYTSDSLTNTTTGATVTISLPDDKTTRTHFVQTQDAQLLYAGKYTTTLKYKINGVEMDAIKASDAAKKPLTNMPMFTVSSNRPTVKISSVSTNPSGARYYLTPTPSSLNVITGVSNQRPNEYSAVVYMYVAAQSGTLDQEQVAIKYPTVNLSLTDVPSNHGGATMVFPGGNNTTSTFNFAAGGTTASSTIGAGADGVFNEGILGFGSGVDSWPIFYPAGKQTVGNITVKYNNIDFTVELTHDVTINNPLYPPYADYKSIGNIDSTYTGNTPSRVYSTDGETITIKLPDAATGNVTMSWNQAMSSTQNQDFIVQSGYPTTRNVYTERSETSGCSTTTYYTPYIETTTVSKASSSTTTWTRTHTITGWKIGNTTYNPGETVTVTGNQTILAVIKTSDGEKATTSSTTTRTEITYTPNGSETTSKPSGSKVNSVTGSTNDVVN